jgi:two-component system, OmpR family, sensor histidine kinase KdpD
MVYTGGRVTSPKPEPDPRNVDEPGPSRRSTALEYALAVTIVTLASGFVALFASAITATDQAMIYLLGVIVVAFRGRLGPALVAALGSVGAYDFLFVPPRFTFDVNESRYLLTFVVMAVVGSVVSSLGAKVRTQALEAEWRERNTARLHQLNINLDQARREAELAADREQLRASLLASVSHDLRTPLATIIGAVTTLEHRQQALDAETRAGLLSVIHEQAEHLSRLLRNLLEMTRLEGDGLRLARELNAVEEPIGTVLATLHSRIGDRSITVRVPSEPLFTVFDPVAVELVLSNLVENALRHGADPIEIEVSVHGDDEIHVCVRDRGPGLVSGDEQRVFEKFYRGPGARAGGAGLGLAIVRILIEASEGRVWARSRTDGPGAEFGFTLPRVAAPRFDEADHLEPAP